MTENKKLLLSSFLIAVLSIITMIVIIPKLNFVNNSGNYNDEKMLDDDLIYKSYCD